MLPASKVGGMHRSFPDSIDRIVSFQYRKLRSSLFATNISLIVENMENTKKTKIGKMTFADTIWNIQPIGSLKCFFKT